MTQQHDPLFERDAQQRAQDLAQASEAYEAGYHISSLFYRARITYLDIEPDGSGWKVSVPPQKGVVGRTKRLHDEMTDEAQFSVRHGTDDGGEFYVLVKRK